MSHYVAIVGRYATVQAALHRQLLDLHDATQRADAVQLIPVLALEVAVLAVDHDGVRPLVEIGREYADHLVELDACRVQEDEVNDVGHDERSAGLGAVVVEALEVEYVRGGVFDVVERALSIRVGHRAAREVEAEQTTT